MIARHVWRDVDSHIANRIHNWRAKKRVVHLTEKSSRVLKRKLNLTATVKWIFSHRQPHTHTSERIDKNSKQNGTLFSRWLEKAKLNKRLTMRSVTTLAENCFHDEEKWSLAVSPRLLIQSLLNTAPGRSVSVRCLRLVRRPSPARLVHTQTHSECSVPLI